MKSKAWRIGLIAFTAAVVLAMAGCQSNVQTDGDGEPSPNVSTSSTEEKNAETTPDKATVENDEGIKRVEDGSIVFRGIPWYCTRTEAEKIVAQDGGKAGSSLSEDIYRMTATNYPNVTMGSDRVDGGGVRVYYSGLSVAGYSVNAYACYMYPIEDNKIRASKEDSLFYFGWYSFEDEFGDHASIYEDLLAKLNGMYGEGTSSESEYFATTNWADEGGNQVRLLIDADKSYVTLGYMASEADEKLDEVKAAVNNTAAAEEQDLRSENTSNTSGL